jgi:hypothetical protein
VANLGGRQWLRERLIAGTSRLADAPLAAAGDGAERGVRPSRMWSGLTSILGYSTIADSMLDGPGQGRSLARWPPVGVDTGPRRRNGDRMTDTPTGSRDPKSSFFCRKHARPEAPERVPQT